MAEVRTKKLQRANSKIREDGKDLHISGQPGIGKTEFRNHLHGRLSDKFKIEQKTVRNQHDSSDLIRHVLHMARRSAAERDAKPNEVVNVSASVGPLSGGATVDDRVQDIHKLEDLTKDWSGQPLILSIDDIHKISDDEKTVRDLIGEISAALGDNVHLITVGQISASQIKGVQQFHLSYFTLDQTRRFLEPESSDISEETVRDVHNKVDGHPLYLDLLSATSEFEDDFDLPEDEVFQTIEQRYLESLPFETEEFLRRISPLPELNEKTVNAILEDSSQTEVSRRLRNLNRRAIVKEVNRTDEGDRLYKIQEHFREFLVRKHEDPAKINRKALDYHLNKLLEIIGEESENTWARSLPHSFHVKHHMEELYGDFNAEDFQVELDRVDIRYPDRMMIIVYAGLSIFNTDVLSLLKQERDRFRDWIFDELENDPTADLIVQLADWGLSQFDDEPMELSDVRVDASLDDLPEQSEPFAEFEMSEKHVDELQRSTFHILSFFFEQEPYQSEEHRRLAMKNFERYGISLSVLKRFRDRLEEVLLNSELGDEVGDVLEEYFDSLEKELLKAHVSDLDMYDIRSQSMRFGEELFDSVHQDVLLDSGVFADMALNCGEVLEDAKNPAFAMLWYSMFIAYFRQNPEETECFEELTDRFERMVAARQSYEEDLDDPMLLADDAKDTVELETTDPN